MLKLEYLSQAYKYKTYYKVTPLVAGMNSSSRPPWSVQKLTEKYSELATYEHSINNFITFSFITFSLKSLKFQI